MNEENIGWEAQAEERFKQVIAKMPVFLRAMGKKQVQEKAFEFAQKEKRKVATEKDLVDALFATTPSAFQGMMMDDLKSLNIDYEQYGHKDFNFKDFPPKP